jgi:hypothetical protein
MLSLRFVMRRSVFVMLVFCGLVLSWLLVLRLVVLRLLILLLLCHLPHLQLFLLLLVVRVLVFTAITVVAMDMWRHSATGKKKVQKAQSYRSSQGTSGTGSRGFERSSAGSETQEILMLLHPLAASTSSGVVGYVTQPSLLISFDIVSQSSGTTFRSFSRYCSLVS